MQRKIYIFVGPIDLSKIFKIIQIFFWGGDKLKAFKNFFTTPLCTSFSLTRLGDLLHFGQLFKARGNNYFAQSANTF